MSTKKEEQLKEYKGGTERYTCVTEGIEVTVTPEFLPERSNLEQGLFAYIYTVTIENQSEQTVQLVNRHWLVYSAGKQIADVKGEGVVGEQPVLEPGAIHEYTSGTVVHDEVGSMKGSYTFFSETGSFFDVEIPEFHLLFIDPQAVH